MRVAVKLLAKTLVVDDGGTELLGVDGELTKDQALLEIDSMTVCMGTCIQQDQKTKWICCQSVTMQS
jgi:hypothetical protein